jgi:hypothetical protein
VIIVGGAFAQGVVARKAVLGMLKPLLKLILERRDKRDLKVNISTNIRLFDAFQYHVVLTACK